MDSHWMNYVSEYLSQNEILVKRFEFPYMKTRRITGSRRPPDKALILEKCWNQAISEPHDGPLFLMGKSMGARIASHIGNDTPALGYIALGYPFHPSRKPLSDRHHPLLELKLPSVIFQGVRDALGNQFTLKNVKLKAHQQFIWITDGDHSFNPRKSSGLTLEDNLNEVCDNIICFIYHCLEAKS